jgi:hypothetical protein
MLVVLVALVLLADIVTASKRLVSSLPTVVRRQEQLNDNHRQYHRFLRCTLDIYP